MQRADVLLQSLQNIYNLWASFMIKSCGHELFPINCFDMTGELETVTNPRYEIQVRYDANDAHLGYERVAGEEKRIDKKIILRENAYIIAWIGDYANNITSYFSFYD